MEQYIIAPRRPAKGLAVIGTWLTVVAGLTAIPARATITYTCAANVDAAQAGTCNFLNTTVAGLYASAFSDANANIYVQMGSTGLGESTTGYYNTLSYSTYLADLTANSVASGDSIQVAAVSALNSYDTTAYGSDSVVITSALGEALGVPDQDLFGTTGSTFCTIGTTGCYNGIITITNNTSILYWNQEGGSETSSEYDFYSVVEHETDEVLGDGVVHQHAVHTSHGRLQWLYRRQRRALGGRSVPLQQRRKPGAQLCSLYRHRILSEWCVLLL